MRVRVRLQNDQKELVGKWRSQDAANEDLGPASTSMQFSVRRIYERNTSQHIPGIRTAARAAAVRSALEQDGRMQHKSGLFECREAETHGPWSGEVNTELKLDAGCSASDWRLKKENYSAKGRWLKCEELHPPIPAT